jgi:hypothetical protein
LLLIEHRPVRQKSSQEACSFLKKKNQKTFACLQREFTRQGRVRGNCPDCRLRQRQIDGETTWSCVQGGKTAVPASLKSTFRWNVKNTLDRETIYRKHPQVAEENVPCAFAFAFASTFNP